jgi:peptidoglycan-associated lipoprotein
MMRVFHISLLILALCLIVGCSKKNKTPPPLLSDTTMPGDELSDTADLGASGGPYRSSGGGLDSGSPSLGASSPSTSGGKWDEASSADQPLTQRPYSGEWSPDLNLSAVYFDYNSSTLADEAVSILQRNAAYAKENPRLRILIEGHCDERGTEEYNQALGEKRALATREYLISQGIAVDRIDILSYGELRPAVEGSGESAWSRNRRCEFKVAG